MYKKSSYFLLLLLFFTSTLNAKEDSFGIEINPFKLITAGQFFSAGVSYFDNSNGIEYAIPVSSVFNDNERSEWEGMDTKYDYNQRDITVDFHIRKYTTSIVDGFFVGLFSRYTYLEGKVLDEPRLASQHKGGVGVEIGYRSMRMFESFPLYWGWSFGVGRYLNKTNAIFDEDEPALSIDDEKIFFDIELLKFGYEF